VAAVTSASACSDDAIDNQRLCSRQECPPGTDRFAVIECCGDEAKADIFWCFATAGVNGPDPEYNPNCCHPDN
jgi:hypothetical protein